MKNLSLWLRRQQPRLYLYGRKRWSKHLQQQNQCLKVLLTVTVQGRPAEHGPSCNLFVRQLRSTFDDEKSKSKMRKDARIKKFSLGQRGHRMMERAMEAGKTMRKIILKARLPFSSLAETTLEDRQRFLVDIQQHQSRRPR